MPHNNWYRHDWTEERIARLKKLWHDGWSASECAAKLGLGITRNSVIGKIHRLGLSGTYRRPRERGRKRMAKPDKPAQLLETTEQPVSRPQIPQMRPDLRPPQPPPQFSLSLLQLKPGQCRWPQGDGPFRFCGAPQALGSSYCAEHRRRSTTRGSVQPVHFSVKKWSTAA
jgi:GcrA cell cycle regulator